MRTKIYFLRLEYRDGSVGTYDVFAAKDHWDVEEINGLPDNEYCCRDMEAAHGARVFSVKQARFVRNDGSPVGSETTELRMDHFHKGPPEKFFHGQIKVCPFCGEVVELEEGLQGTGTREESRADVTRDHFSTSTGQRLGGYIYLDGWMAKERVPDDSQPNNAR